MFFQDLFFKFLFLLDLSPLEGAFVLFVLVEEGSVVLPEVLLAEDPVQVVHDPRLVVQHEVVLHCLQLQVLLILAYLQVLVCLAQLLTNQVSWLLLVQFELHG